MLSCVCVTGTGDVGSPGGDVRASWSCDLEGGHVCHGRQGSGLSLLLLTHFFPFQGAVAVMVVTVVSVVLAVVVVLILVAIGSSNHSCWSVKWWSQHVCILMQHTVNGLCCICLVVFHFHSLSVWWFFTTLHYLCGSSSIHFIICVLVLHYTSLSVW